MRRMLTGLVTCAVLGLPRPIEAPLPDDPSAIHIRTARVSESIEEGFSNHQDHVERLVRQYFEEIGVTVRMTDEERPLDRTHLQAMYLDDEEFLALFPSSRCGDFRYRDAQGRPSLKGEVRRECPENWAGYAFLKEEDGTPARTLAVRISPDSALQYTSCSGPFVEAIATMYAHELGHLGGLTHVEDGEMLWYAKHDNLMHQDSFDSLKPRCENPYIGATLEPLQEQMVQAGFRGEYIWKLMEQSGFDYAEYVQAINVASLASSPR